jgi:uncharacterized protein (DUF885 family)
VKALLAMTLLAGGAPAQALIDRFFDESWFRFQPTAATSAGVHRWDHLLEDYSRAGVARQVAALKKFEAGFSRLAPSPDHVLALNAIRARLLELQTIRMWERNPDLYSSAIANSAFTLMSRTFAPPEVRLKALIARERRMPQALADARANLRNPPRIYSEIALEQIPGIVSFFEHDLPLAFQAVRDKSLLASFRSANQAVIRALRAYERWIQTDLLPRSGGDFRLGAENYARKLRYEEMVDIPLDRLLEIGYADLRANQKRFAETAALADRSKSPREILAELERDHPAPDKLLDAFRGTLAGLRNFIAERRIVTLPSPVEPILEETPPFLRALTSASMDTPGPFEQVAKEAYFNVTLPDKSWPAERVENFLHGFHRGTILATAVHEAYPGHYTQMLWTHRIASKARKLLGASSSIEGWAHYAEQMMLDEGYAAGDPRMRLGQLQDALLRNARYIVGIEMHTGKRTFEQGVEFFEREGYQPHEIALRETKRGTSDPTYLYYTLGKLQILKLREDYRKLKGAGFSLLEFHDALMSEGPAPIPLVRRALLGDDSPAL